MKQQEKNTNPNKITNKYALEYLRTGQIPSFFAQDNPDYYIKQLKKEKKENNKKSTIRINTEIRDLANICSLNKKMSKEEWIENLILREAQTEHRIILKNHKYRSLS